MIYHEVLEAAYKDSESETGGWLQKVMSNTELDGEYNENREEHKGTGTPTPQDLENEGEHNIDNGPEKPAKKASAAEREPELSVGKHDATQEVNPARNTENNGRVQPNTAETAWLELNFERKQE